MSYRLRISNEAEVQLRTIARWYENTSQSVEVAANWYDGFLDALDVLKEQPWRGAVSPENAQFDFDLRELHYGSGKRLTHRAMYRVTGDVVEILSVRHLMQKPLGPSDLQS